MEIPVTIMYKLSHKQFRAMLKKFKRKKKRQQLAKLREQQELLEQEQRESSPGYKEREEERLRNIKLLEEFEEREKVRKHKEWLVREEMAQADFKRKQYQLELENIKREKERKRILEEFERQQYVENQAEEENKKIKSQKEVDQSFKCVMLVSKYFMAVLQEALSNLEKEDGPWHNPIAPEHYNIGQEREQCMFFSKTGCCRFGERCSRGHTRPDVSCTILIKGMYSHFSIDQTARDDYDTDIALEYEDKECYQDFKNFYYDVLPEFKKFGRVVQFKVCSNFEPHLRGNVYVQYARETAALEAYKKFNGRYYAGKQITCEFTHVTHWRSAICGLHNRNLCPKGMNCNFLHVFKNPNDEFWEADYGFSSREKSHSSHSSRSRNYARDEKPNGYSSEHRYHRKKYESRSSRYEPLSDRHNHRSNRHDSRSDKYDSDWKESKRTRYEFKRDKYESRSGHHDDRLQDSSTDMSEEECHSARLRKDNKNDDHNSKYEKLNKNQTSVSRSKSPTKVSPERKSSHRKKKHKKKSKKRKRQHSSDSDVD